MEQNKQPQKDIFSLESLADVPMSMRSGLKITKINSEEKRILELFSIAGGDALTLDQIIVGYYRLFGIEQDRKKLTIKIYNMTRGLRPTIQSVPKRRGVYKLRGLYT